MGNSSLSLRLYKRAIWKGKPNITASPKIDVYEEGNDVIVKTEVPGMEKDEIEILSGIFEEKTTGAPVCIIVRNKDADSSKYEQIKHLFRPGHADYAFLNKYGMRDYRGGGRSSGRETLCRVAAGAVAKKIITGTKVIAYTLQVGNIRAEKIDYGEIEKNSVRCPDKAAAKKMENLIESVKKEGDSIGGIIEVVVKNPPQGLGDPVFDKLDADIAKANDLLGYDPKVSIKDGLMKIKNLYE